MSFCDAWRRSDQNGSSSSSTPPSKRSRLRGSSWRARPRNWASRFTDGVSRLRIGLDSHPPCAPSLFWNLPRPASVLSVTTRDDVKGAGAMRHSAIRSSVRLLLALWMGMSLLTACGAVEGDRTRSLPGVPTPTASTPRTPAPGEPAPTVPTKGIATPPDPKQAAVTLTNADDGKTVQVKVGDMIHLALQAPEGYKNWEVGA